MSKCWGIDVSKYQGGKVDSFGVGERLITAKSDPVFGGVYKLAAVEQDGELIPKIKVSENVEKITNPGFKVPWRLYERETGKAIADVMETALAEEQFIVYLQPKYSLSDNRMVGAEARYREVLPLQLRRFRDLQSELHPDELPGLIL